MRAAFHTLGCKVNQYETEAIKESFIKRGFEIVGEEDPADVYVVNTCTVTNVADRKSRQYIRRMKRVNPASVMIVTGCYAQIAADELEKMEDIDIIVGNNLKSKICDMAEDVLNGREKKCVEVLGRSELKEYEDMGIVTSAESAMSRAYIKIEEGCDRFCSYCLIPFARGSVRSRPADEIVEEAEDLVAKGFKEIVLTGINTALYGSENGCGAGGPIAQVIERLDAIDGDFRIRLSSLEPTVVRAENVEALLRYEKLCHHLHLSVQSGSDRILKAMNRRYTARDYLDIVDALRRFDPFYGVTTDIIVGFPGETDEDFTDTLEVVRQAKFARVHIFKYSPRKNTAAAKFADAVPGEVKNERAKILEEVAKETAESFNAENFDIPAKVLVEECEDGYLAGYTDNYIKTYIEDRTVPEKAVSAEIGDFIGAVPFENYRDGVRACIAERPR